MILGIGIDLIEVARVARQLAADGAGFRDTVFTPAEIAYCDRKHFPAQHYAARFAAKEAAFKALALPADFGAVWREVEVASDAGVPRLVLTGRLGGLAAARGVRRAHVSLSHTQELATASVVLED
ncbi:MAG: holo-ACP synthase [Candidatus Krumholzibacteriia bacterium]